MVAADEEAAVEAEVATAEAAAEAEAVAAAVAEAEEEEAAEVEAGERRRARKIRQRPEKTWTTAVVEDDEEAGSGALCSPRHRMAFHSRNEGKTMRERTAFNSRNDVSKCVRGWHSAQGMKGQHASDDVASNVCEALGAVRGSGAQNSHRARRDRGRHARRRRARARRVAESALGRG